MELERCTVRPWRMEDAAAIQRHADNRKIWINLRDGFPSPYTVDDARRFIASAMAERSPTRFAIVVNGEAAGGIGFSLHNDVERVSAEIGYWLGEAYWNRGIATEALRAVTVHAMEKHGLTRVFAVPYEWSSASCRVLEKAGYVLEGRMRRSAIKDGTVIDQLLYACTRDPVEAGLAGR
jgi:RimJ/RimL family protein N-acetyltransferase